MNLIIPNQATSGTDSSGDLRNNFLSLAQGRICLTSMPAHTTDKKVHWKAANRVYIGNTRLNIASGELNMANFNSYIATNLYWAKALLNINMSGELDIRVGTQAQYSGETTMPTIPSYEIPLASVNFQRNGSSIQNIANTNIDDMRPVVMGHDGVTNATNATMPLMLPIPETSEILAEDLLLRIIQQRDMVIIR